MSNVLVEFEIPTGSIIQKGIPADTPEAALAALRDHFQRRPNVEKAYLGLMKIIPPEQEGQFTYTIGIVCDAGQVLHEKSEAFKVVLGTPPGRWPVSIYPFGLDFFVPGAICFYERKPVKTQKSGSWLRRLFG